MGFYGGRTGQHFAIAGVYESKAAVPVDLMSNQFVLVKDNEEYVFYVKSGSNLIEVGKVGALAPSITATGDWQVGGEILGKAQPYQIFLKIPYDEKTKSYIPEKVTDADGNSREACFIKYAYSYIDPVTADLDSIDIPDNKWHNLVEVSGLHTLNTYIKEFTEKSEIIEDQTLRTEENTNLTQILYELTKSYFNGRGTLPDDFVEYPEEYETEIKERLENEENQTSHNILTYYSDIQAAEGRIQDVRNEVDIIRNSITENLDYINKVDGDTWRAMVTAELSAAARANVSTGDRPLLSERLDKMLYQFDTFADMRVFPQLSPGDSCITFGINRLGDSHSLLFRVYENDAEMKDSGDLHEDGGKYYINLPGGKKQLSEKQQLKNGYVAYSIAMFSGLGSGGSGSGSTSSGSISTTYTGGAIQTGTTVTIPIEWYGQVQGDGTLYVFERAETAIGSTPYLTQYPFPEGHGSFNWTAEHEGNRVLVIYVEDRMHNKTNQLKLNMRVGGLNVKLTSLDNQMYDYGKPAEVSLLLSSILDGTVTIAYSLNKKQSYKKTVTVKSGVEQTMTLDFQNLEANAYTVDMVISQEGLPEIKLTTHFFVTASGQVSISNQFDESSECPINEIITIPYMVQSKDDKGFINKFYLGGGDLEIANNEKVIFNNIAYKYIGEMSAEGGVQKTFQLNPETWQLNANQTYYLMITSQGINFSNIVGEIKTPITIKTVEASDELELEGKWCSSSLMYYFDARKGQQNTDANRISWENLAPKYNSQNYGALDFALVEKTFNWATNGWNPAGHEGLYFNGTATANISGSGINSIYSFNGAREPVFGKADNDGKTTGVGLTLSFYLKTEDLGEDARLFEFPYVSGDGEIGVSINTKQVKVSRDKDDYFGLTAAIVPNEKTHIAIVFEPIGTTKYQYDEEKDPVWSGLIRIYINGICRAATTVISDFFSTIQTPASQIQFNASLKDIEDTGSNPDPKYPQGAFELYTFKVFNRNLSQQEVLYNYIYDIKNFDTQKTLLGVNKLHKDYLTITNPEVCLYPPLGTLNGITKEDPPMVMKITYETNPSIDSIKTYENCEVKWQGTSSIAYPVKNYKIKFPSKFSLDSEGRHVTSGGVGKLEKTYTLKADYMDSSHCHNTCNANFVNDTGLLTEYSLTPAQVQDIYVLNYDSLNSAFGDPYRDILTNIEKGIYYYQIDENNYRPYKLSDFPKDVQLQIRNSIYGIPCELYAYINTEGSAEPVKTFLGIYNFNNDKGNLDTFGLERQAALPGCTSFEIAANSNSTSGAFKERQLVAHYITDDAGHRTLEGYYSTNLSTTYKLSADNSKYIISLFTEGPYCECCKFTVNDNKLYVQSILDASYLIKKDLELIEDPAKAWPDSNLLAQYNDLLDEYYISDFELRAPDNDNYYADGKPKKIPTLEYYSEYDKLKKLINWVNNANAAEFKANFTNHFDLDTALNYYLFVMTTGLIDNFGKNLMINTWGCDNTGKVPYLTKEINGNSYYKVRRFSRLKDGKDVGLYEYGYSLCNALPGEETIVIYNLNGEALGEPIETVGKDYKWNDVDYIETEERSTGYWQKLMDEDKFIWYTHPYDLDSCLGLDNMGRLRYGADIEMLPKDANDGYNDYYDHAYQRQNSAFNTATSNLWKKFYECFNEEIQERYAELRNRQILHMNTFKEYYYNRSISKISAKAYNLDMEAKYLDSEIANVVINGSPAQVYPTSYTFMCHGDDWNRIEQWLKTRLSFLDSLYQYGFMTDVITARADKGNYSLQMELHTPQYLAISWTNKQSGGTEDTEHIWTDASQNKYGLVYNVFSLSTEEIEYGFVQVKSGDEGYEYDEYLYLYDINAKDHVLNTGGNYYKVYAVNTNNSTNFRDWTPILNEFDYGYTTYWAPGLANASQGSFEITKVREEFVTPAEGRTRLVTSSASFGYSGTTGDQEVNIYGASNIKQLRGLQTLTPRSLNLDGAHGLLELECHGGTYSELNLANLTSLKKINLSNTMSLNQSLDVSNIKNLMELDLGLTNVSAVTFPDDGGVLSRLTLGPQTTALSLTNQTSLKEVTLQAHLNNNSITGKEAINKFGNIKNISLKNCQDLKFKFQAIQSNTSKEEVTYMVYDLPEEDKNGTTELGRYIKENGLFSMFKDLQTLSLANSCLYAIGENGEFILSPKHSDSWSGEYSGQWYIRDCLGLQLVNIEEMPIKKFVIDATKYNVSFPGKGTSTEYANTQLSLNSDLEEIYVKGNGYYSVYMPSLNDWHKYINLKRIHFDNVNIYSKEERYESKGVGENLNALAIILPDTETLQDITFNSPKTNPKVDITSIGVDISRLNITSNIITEKEKNTINIKHPIKINFTGLRKIEVIQGLENIVLKNINISSEIPAIATFASYFNGCQKLNSLLNSKGEPFNFETSSGIKWNKFLENPSLEKMFYYCENLTDAVLEDFIGENTEYGESGQYNVSALTTAESMFEGCTKLTKLYPTFVNVLNLETMKSFARNCKNITSFSLTAQTGDAFTNLTNLIEHVDAKQSKLIDFNLDIKYRNNIQKNFGLQTVQYMNNMLLNCDQLQTLNMEDWVLSGLIEAKNMCYNNKALVELKMPVAFTFNNLTNANAMFSGCTNLKEFNSIWAFNKPVDLSQMFLGCSSLNPSFLQNWTMKNVVNISQIFKSVSTSIDQFDIGFWDASSITNMSEAFSGTKIKKFFSSNTETSFSAVTDIASLFNGNTVLAEFDSNLIPSSSGLTSINKLFNGCSDLTNIGDGYKSWNVSAASDFTYLFAGTKITELYLSSWDCSSATKYDYMFSGCGELTSIDGLEKLFPSSSIKNRSVTYLFNGCAKLAEATLKKIASWNMFDENGECLLTSLEGMFIGCNGLTSFSSSIFPSLLKKYSNITSIDKLFQNCTSLTSIIMPAFTKLTTARQMCDGCTALNTLNLNGVNFAQCNDSFLIYGSSSDGKGEALYKWLNNCTNISTLIFSAANEETRIGFNKATVNLSSLNLANNETLKNRLFGIDSDYTRGGTYRIANAILTTDDTTDCPDIIFPKAINDFVNDTTNTSIQSILSKHWMVGVG